jgi:long-subunit acyl-CoA synthetase (AMP-forming)
VAGVGVTIAADGEIVVRTHRPQALGYVFDGVETQDSVFLPGGIVATGDLGRIGRAGFLTIVGRKKNVIITRSGVKINPEELESDLEMTCKVSRALVVAPDGTGLLSCVMWLDEWRSPERAQEIEARVAGWNSQRSAPLRITKVVLRPDAELTAETGLLTRNLKIDRNAVMRTVFADSDQAEK